MKVLKFGGTSVANAQNIEKVIAIIKNEFPSDRLAIVVSAFGGITNQLLEASLLAKDRDISYKTIFDIIETKHLEVIRELITINNQSSVIGAVKKKLNQLENILEGIFLINEFSAPTADKVTSFGEILSSFIIYRAIEERGIEIQLKNSQELIITDHTNQNALVNFEITNERISNYFENNKSQVTILPGFVANTIDGETTTLGRGGSDYTAAIVAAATNSSMVEIWTDVSGMYTANPKIVKQAFPIQNITYREAMELSHFGAKVLYPPTIQPAMRKGIPILIKNTFNPDEKGTLIEFENSNTTSVRGISHIEEISLLTIEGGGMVGVTGFSQRFFASLSKEEINIALITQASSEHSICIAVSSKDIERAKKTVSDEFKYDIERGIVSNILIENEVAIIALVGDNMKNHQGISGKMFSTLGRNNINIRAIAQGASERNISAVIAKKDIKKALNSLHAQFFENQIKILNLYIIGVGNVGGKLLEQITQQKSYLLNTLLIKVKVVGLANSRKMIFDDDGIDLSNWKREIKDGEIFHQDKFINQIQDYNLINSVFVDNTDSKAIADLYASLLKLSTPVVTCNKIACSSSYENFALLNRLSQEYNAPFLYETNVGAGLPIIKTLKDLIASGDHVISIQAVLSGSLNFIFNHFDNTQPFYNVIEQAMEVGYTEPDPRIDLKGVDVIRKILILIRETGDPLEFDDVEVVSFLPKKAEETSSVDEFFKIIQQENDHFSNLYEQAKQENCKLRVVATYENKKAKVELQKVGVDHPFYRIEGKDNIVLFYTNRYKEQPLIIKGAGAGAEVTASGLFADIIKIGSK